MIQSNFAQTIHIYACHLPRQKLKCFAFGFTHSALSLSLALQITFSFIQSRTHTLPSRRRRDRSERSASSFHNGIHWICEWESELVEIYSTHKINAKTGGFNIERNARVRTACVRVCSLQTLFGGARVVCALFLLAFADRESVLCNKRHTKKGVN